MKILLFLLNLRRGGMEKIAILLDRELHKLGCSSQLIALHEPNEYPDLLKAYGRNLSVIFERKPAYFWTHVLPMVRELRTNAIKRCPDAIVVFGVHALILSRLAGLRPIIFTMHNSGALHWRSTRPNSLVLSMLEKWAMRGRNLHITFCSPSVRQACIDRFGLPKGLSQVIYNSTDIESFNYEGKSISVEEPNILAVGTIYFQKNYPMAIHGLATLHAIGMRARLLIAGDGPDREEIIKTANELAVGKYVELLGRREDIPELMRNADCLWMTSRCEGFGLVLAEAMAAGLPIIATRVPGIVDVIEDGSDGLLVPLDDHVALAERTFSLLQDPVRKHNMIELAYKKAIRLFHPRRLAKEYLNFIQKVCGQ